MAEITASAVKALREKSGAGMIDVKNALVEANGDEAAAMEILRKKGVATAGKKAGRVTAEGQPVDVVSPIVTFSVPALDPEEKPANASASVAR